MGIDVENLSAAVARHGRVTRVVIAGFKGSCPREIGAAMLVWKDGQSGTIGGGTLEYEATRAARNQQEPGLLSTHALGPDLGQCCGGSVTLLSEVYDAARLSEFKGELYVRTVNPGPMPLAVKRLLAQARSKGVTPEPQLVQGWMVEPFHRAQRYLFVWGAGHVGRAVVDVLAPLPNFSITWVDTAPDRFPEMVPQGVTILPAAKPALVVPHTPKDAEHLVLTYSHALDLEICHHLLLCGFDFAGLIGSATKWARFRSRLKALGHTPEQISRITCPIGDPALGKHPQMIAVGVAAELLHPRIGHSTQKDKRA